MEHKPLIVIILGALLAALLTGCGQTSAVTPPPTNTPLSGRITFAGSTTLQPLAGKLGDVFKQRQPGVALEIAAGGSVIGIQAIHEGTADIGMASRALKPDEAKGIEQHQIALDVLAVVVNPANPLTGLTLKQLQGIYSGQIKNWQELGGANQPITVVIREKTSGTRGAFDEIALEKKEPAASNLKVAITAGDMAAIVAEDPAAIGYVGFGNLEATIKALAIDQTPPTKAAARSGAYKLVRPLLLLTGPLTQPLALTYIDFALSVEGQQLIQQDGWVPIK